MRRQSLGLIIILLSMVVVLLATGALWAQTANPSSPISTPAKSEEAKDNSKQSSTAALETPAIDPDVKQWFLEKMKQRLPADPKDVETLTGRARDAENVARYPNYGYGLMAPYWGGSPWDYSRGNPEYRSRFAMPGFFLFGNRFGDGGNRLLVGNPFFLPFGSTSGNLRPR
jgi:hypothetical protein